MKNIEIPNIAAIALCILGSAATAEPTQKIERFMDLNVSVFSFGIFRLEQFLQDTMFDGSGVAMRPPLYGFEKYLSKAEYNWDKNRLEISAYTFRFEPQKNWNGEAECSQVLDLLRTYLGVDRKTGRPREGNASGLRYFFNPIGYTLQGLKNENFEELDNITSLTFYVLGEKETAIRCEAPLLGTGFSVVKPPP